MNSLRVYLINPIVMIMTLETLEITQGDHELVTRCQGETILMVIDDGPASIVVCVRQGTRSCIHHY